MKKPDNYDYFIDTIIYKNNNVWITRSVDFCHRHPIEYIQPQKTPDGLPVFNFFLDIYIDKFGPFRNAYHAIEGIYLQIGNMSQVMRQKLKNHFLLAFIPFGANCENVLNPLIENIKELEKGFAMDMNDKQIWITGGLGNITSDLPEGNEQAGIKNHNANYGCCMCTINHDELNDMSFDLVAGARYHHKTSLQFAELSNAQTYHERNYYHNNMVFGTSL